MVKIFCPRPSDLCWKGFNGADGSTAALKAGVVFPAAGLSFTDPSLLLLLLPDSVEKKAALRGWICLVWKKRNERGIERSERIIEE